MDKALLQFRRLKIQLEDVTSATNEFDDNNRIGDGGFGSVYKGELSHVAGRSMVAIKRLNREQDQGDAEFLKEIRTLSHYKHENLIALLGFCYQGDEAILVYQLASRGSLEKHLDSHELTWLRRLNICLGAAKGLGHLHDPMETHQRLIHCDVKSGNILLDDEWNAKVADFGFSVMGPANEVQSTIVNLAAGTRGYCDPQYAMTNERVRLPEWIKSYEEKKLNDIIFKSPTLQPLHQSALEVFSDIAYQCLQEAREDRPEMEEIVTELEIALEGQDSFESQELVKDQEFKGVWNRQHSYYRRISQSVFSDIAYQCLKEAREDRPEMEEIVTEVEIALEGQDFFESQELVKNQEFKGVWNRQHSYHRRISQSAKSPLHYISEAQLKKKLYMGVLLNEGKTWFSLNKKGEHCEMISVAECMGLEFKSEYTLYKSRFPLGSYPSHNGIFKTRARTQFLSPGITYTVNLVFRFSDSSYYREQNGRLTCLKYKLQGETWSSISYLAYGRKDDDWLMCELYQFTSGRRIVHFEIMFDGYNGSYSSIEVEGIEFRPLEIMDEEQPILDSDEDENWEEKLPTDYEDILKRSENSVQWATKAEAYSIIRNGFLISNDKMKGKIWFFLENGKKCHMLSAAHVCNMWSMNMLPLPESRFGEAIQCDSQSIDIRSNIETQLVSSKTTYAIYLVYKLHDDHVGFEAPMRVKGRDLREEVFWHIYLESPQTPVIRPKVDQNTHNPLGITNIKGLPRQRKDGWMEVQIWEFIHGTIDNLSLKLTSCDEEDISGLIIEGIEFRPTPAGYYCSLIH